LINEKDLEELSCGVAYIDIDILKNNTQYDVIFKIYIEYKIIVKILKQY